MNDIWYSFLWAQFLCYFSIFNCEYMAVIVPCCCLLLMRCYHHLKLKTTEWSVHCTQCVLCAHRHFWEETDDILKSRSWTVILQIKCSIILTACIRLDARNADVRHFLVQLCKMLAKVVLVVVVTMSMETSPQWFFLRFQTHACRRIRKVSMNWPEASSSSVLHRFYFALHVYVSLCDISLNDWKKSLMVAS